jgi:nucleoside-diphosphate-sugar epimerase
LGSLTPTRDFNYVKDTTRGFIEIAKADRSMGEEINIATGVEISIGEVATELISQLNPKANIITEDERMRPEKSEVNRLLGCNQKILSLTDWQPRFNLADGLSATIDWFRLPENLSRYKTDIYNL